MALLLETVESASCGMMPHRSSNAPHKSPDTASDVSLPLGTSSQHGETSQVGNSVTGFLAALSPPFSRGRGCRGDESVFPWDVHQF